MINNRKKCGIITFHAAYNFGSVLQAYALQYFLMCKGFDSKIINYRMDEQKYVYSVLRRGEGIKGCIKNMLSINLIPKKIERKKKFEEFISTFLNLTFEFSDPKGMNQACEDFDIVISGSDQIWNKHSNELHSVTWDYMYPYLLLGLEKKRISYASSIGNMVDEGELRKICNIIKDFDHISVREKSAAEIIHKFIPNDIEVVLDPTFLLSKSDWILSIGIEEKTNHNHILFYSLASNKTLKRIQKLLNDLLDKGYYIDYITPYCYGSFIETSRVHNCLDYGPTDFLKSINNADMILTDSYHGTILSINFEKEVFSINGEYASDYRKTDLLKELGIMSHSIGWDSNIDDLLVEKIDYITVGQRLKELRKQSRSYLIESIER